MDGFIRITRVIADPPLIDLRVIARLDAMNDPFIMIEINVLPTRIHRTDGRRALQQPYALLKEKILIEQRADRTQVDDIPRQFIIDRPAGENINLLLVTAPVDK